MRILHVINGLSVTRGGPSATLAAVVGAQVRRGHEVVVLSTMRQPPPLTLQPGEHGNLTVCEAPPESESKWYNAQVLAAARRLARDCQIVHVHGSWRYHLLAAAKVCREYKLPYIIRPAGNLGLISAGHRWYLKRPYFYLFERRAFNRAAAIHCTSREEMRQMAGLRLRARKFVVPNAVSVERSESIRCDALRGICPGLQPHHKVILYLGRITWIKRLDALLEGFIQVQRDFPEWCMILAGPLEDSQIVRRLRAASERHGISERVLLPGTVLGEAKAALFQRAEIFAQPSLHENFGASVAEALCYGIPCAVSSGVALAPDVAEAGAGIVCESEAAALAMVLRRLMGDPELRAEYGRGALALAKRYQPDHVAAQLDVEYQTCINGKETNSG